MSVYLSIHLECPSIHVAIHPSIYTSIYLYPRRCHLGYAGAQHDLGWEPPLLPSPLYLRIYLSIYSPIVLSVYLDVHLSIYTYRYTDIDR